MESAGLSIHSWVFIIGVLFHLQVGLIPLLELLLQNGARAGWADAAGRQPLHYAVLAGRTEAAKLLVGVSFMLYAVCMLS